MKKRNKVIVRLAQTEPQIQLISLQGANSLPRRIMQRLEKTIEKVLTDIWQLRGISRARNLRISGNGFDATLDARYNNSPNTELRIWFDVIVINLRRVARKGRRAMLKLETLKVILAAPSPC